VIALDTNILVRYFVGADDAETHHATTLIENALTADDPGFISAVTLCEIIWVVRNRYGFGIEAQGAVIRLMSEAAQLLLEHKECANAALASGHSDIADAIIHHIGQANGCAKTVTFDKKFARLEGVELLA
jgi:predicted nucleic-acid-binding protein